MKEFFQHEKIQHLIKRSRPANYSPYKGCLKNPPINTSPTKKERRDHVKEKKVVPALNLNSLNSKMNNRENIKKKITNETKKEDLIHEVKDLMKNFTSLQNHASNETVKNLEINQQQLSFRERLNEKKKTMKSSRSIVFFNKSEKKTSSFHKDAKEREAEKEKLLKELSKRRRKSNACETSRDMHFIYGRDKAGKRMSINVNTEREKISKIFGFDDDTPKASDKGNSHIPHVDINLIDQWDGTPKNKKDNSDRGLHNKFSDLESKDKFFEDKVTLHDDGIKTARNGSTKHMFRAKERRSKRENLEKSKFAEPSNQRGNNKETNKEANKDTNKDTNTEETLKEAIKHTEVNISDPTEETLNKNKISNNGKAFIHPETGSKNSSSKNMVFYDKQRNSIRISHKKLIEIQHNILSPKVRNLLT